MKPVAVYDAPMFVGVRNDVFEGLSCRNLVFHKDRVWGSSAVIGTVADIYTLICPPLLQSKIQKCVRRKQCARLTHFAKTEGIIADSFY